MMIRNFVSVLLAVACCGCWTGCGRAEPSGAVADQATVELAPPIDALLMAYLSKARALHHQADLHEQDNDLKAAIADLQTLIATPVPGGGRPMQEAQELLADTLARLADLRGQLGDFDAASSDIEQGLQRAPKVSYFEGHLYEIRGINEQRHAKALADRGDPQGAELARRNAMKALERAVSIQDQVINAILSDAGGHGR
jgi:tetratricopeptide (TPR) repeat protein